MDEAYPHAEYIRLVQDNLNTHTPASLYETFSPAEARRILQRLEFHYTPKHGSWLNMAEIEIAILERNALSRCLEDEVALRRQVSAVETERNTLRRGICWQFTSRDARVKLERLYPVKEHYQALQEARAHQKDAAFWEKYRARSGIEGTISTSEYESLVCVGVALGEWRKRIDRTS